MSSINLDQVGSRPGHLVTLRPCTSFCLDTPREHDLNLGVLGTFCDPWGGGGLGVYRCHPPRD
jgi:hypothetical protein